MEKLLSHLFVSALGFDLWFTFDGGGSWED